MEETVDRRQIALQYVGGWDFGLTYCYIMTSNYACRLPELK